MKALAWAFVERLLPRIASALVMLIFAAATNPTIVGSYAWMVVALTGVQSIFDAAVRQVAVGAVQTENGMRFLRRYRIVFASAGPLILLSALFFVSLATADPVGTFFTLLPIAFAPVGTALATVALARLQMAGKWRAIALSQSSAVTTSLLVSLPLVLTTQNALGPALQALLAELFNAALLVFLVRRVQIDIRTSDTTDLAKEFMAASWFAGLGWAQSQADRVLVGAVGGQRVLGLYSFSWSLSRNVGDALSYASVNVLRPQLLKLESTDTQRALSIFRQSLYRVNLLLVAVAIATFVGATWILPLILDQRWETVFTAVPIMSLSSFPLVAAWSLTPILVREGRLRAALFGKILGVAAAVPVGLAAAQDLTLAAWVALAREFLVLLCLAIASRRTVPARAYLPILSSTLILGCALTTYQLVT